MALLIRNSPLNRMIYWLVALNRIFIPQLNLLDDAANYVKRS